MKFLWVSGELVESSVFRLFRWWLWCGCMLVFLSVVRYLVLVLNMVMFLVLMRFSRCLGLGWNGELL